MRLTGITGLTTAAFAFALAGGVATTSFATLHQPAEADAEPAAEGEASMTTLDGVFTEEQAERGLQSFLDNGCAGCHGQDMEGTPGGPKLGAFAFFFEWSERPLSDVFTWTQENMPPGAAGSLNAQTYADILAAILHKGELPTGDAELTPDMMADIILLEAPDEE